MSGNVALLELDLTTQSAIRLWDKCIETLGKAGTMAVLHYVGYYQYIATLLNGCDVPVPE